MFKKVHSHEKMEVVGELHNYDVYCLLAKSLGQPCVSKEVFKPIQFVLPEGIQTVSGNGSYGYKHIDAKHGDNIHSVANKSSQHESMMVCIKELVDLMNDQSRSNISLDLKNNQYLVTAKIKISEDAVVPFVCAFYPKNNFNLVIITFYSIDEVQYQSMCYGSHRFKPISHNPGLRWKVKSTPVVQLDDSSDAHSKTIDESQHVENTVISPANFESGENDYTINNNVNNVSTNIEIASKVEPIAIDDKYHDDLISYYELKANGLIEGGFYSEFIHTLYAAIENLATATQNVIEKKQELDDCNKKLDIVEPLIREAHARLKTISANTFISMGDVNDMMGDIDKIQNLMSERHFNISKDLINTQAVLMAPVVKLQKMGLSYLLDDDLKKYNRIALAVKTGFSEITSRDQKILNNKGILFYSFLLTLKKCIGHYNKNLAIIYQNQADYLTDVMPLFETYLSDKYLGIFKKQIDKIDPRSNIKPQNIYNDLRVAFAEFKYSYAKICSQNKPKVTK